MCFQFGTVKMHKSMISGYIMSSLAYAFLMLTTFVNVSVILKANTLFFFEKGVYKMYTNVKQFFSRPATYCYLQTHTKICVLPLTSRTSILLLLLLLLGDILLLCILIVMYIIKINATRYVLTSPINVIYGVRRSTEFSNLNSRMYLTISKLISQCARASKKLCVAYLSN